MRGERKAILATTIFDGKEEKRDSAVLIEGSRIAWIGPRANLPAEVDVISLPDDAWLAPGFVDLQVNGGGDHLFNADPTPHALARILAAHRRFGTTAMLPTLISDTPEKMRCALEAVRHMPDESGIVGIHFEGPFLSPEKPGVHDPGTLRAPGPSDLELLTSLQSKVTLVTLAPECVPSGFISDLVMRGVKVSLGHSMASYAQTKVALAEGLTGFTHLLNAMRQPESREPGPVPAALESPQASFGMIVDGAHVAPAMLRLALRGFARPMLVTDAMPPVGGSNPQFELFGKSINVRGSACWAPDGRLAGTALDMATAIRNCVKLLGVSLSTALRFASYEPARFAGVSDRLGHLAPGMQADMVALDPVGISVIGTWLAGAWQEAAPRSRAAANCSCG